ncbi:MAG: chloride channel protein [Calditrichia bacterium]
MGIDCSHFPESYRHIRNAGSGGSGGVFAPSLFIGAMLGSFIGDLTHQWQPQLAADSGAYALVGMARWLPALRTRRFRQF